MGLSQHTPAAAVTSVSIFGWVLTDLISTSDFCAQSQNCFDLSVLCRLVGEQRQKNADAERLEGQALKARMEAGAAAERIQHCQNSLTAEEGCLAAKKHEINLKVCGRCADPAFKIGQLCL